MLETLDFTIRIDSTPTSSCFDLYLYSVYVCSTLTDLKNRTGLSIYFLETETNCGHIGGTTWWVQCRYRNENKNSGIFYWKLTNEICWLDTNSEWQSFPLLCSGATEISNMAAGGPFNMAAVGNNISILWSSQNSLVIFMCGVVERKILAAF